jgi:hypothetical protein
MRPALRTLAVLSALAFLLSGCAAPAEVQDEFPEAEFLALEATTTTGVIRGVVVDEAIRPIAGATVAVKGGPAAGRSTNTTDQGAFGLDGLEPGTYFLTITKVGFLAVQQSADVVAGVADPPIVKVVLAVEPGYLPYVSARTYEGFVECTTSFIVLCGLPNLLTGQNITNDRYTWTWFFEPNSTLIQNEMAWESTQSLTPTMYFEMEPSGDCDEGFFNRTEGMSPIYATLNATQIEEGPISMECGIYFSLFSGHNEPLPRQPVTGWGIGVTVQQRFTMFSHTFYDFLPAAGWRFSIEGTPEVPA